MVLAKKSLMSYLGLYQKFLYKSFIILTPPPRNILLIPPLMRQRLSLGEISQWYVILKKMCMSTVVSVNSPNDLPTQQLDDISLTHQAQVTCHGLSYEAVFFSSTTVPGKTFCCAKRFVFVW